jgi:hypothetical protein
MTTEVLLDLLLVTRLGVHDVPAARPVEGRLGLGTGLLLEEVFGVDGRGVALVRRLLGGVRVGRVGVGGLDRIGDVCGHRENNFSRTSPNP